MLGFPLVFSFDLIDVGGVYLVFLLLILVWLV